MRIAPPPAGRCPSSCPRSPSTRPAWQIRAGLLLYDWLAGRSPFRRSRGARPSSPQRARSSKPGESIRIPRHYDGWADDARLVVADVMDAAARGCTRD